MKRRRFAALIAIAVSPLLLLPLGYYAFFAFVRHKHFYHAFPTSYWAQAVRHWDPSASRMPSSVPYADAVLDYLGFGVTPAIAQGDEAAIPVLLRLIWNEDKDVGSRACVALAHSIPEMKDDATARGYAGEAFVFQNRIILCLVDTRYKTHTFLILIDQAGRYLDDLDCTGVCEWLASTGRLRFGLEDGGREFAIRYMLDAQKSSRLVGDAVNQPSAADLPKGDVIVMRSNNLVVYGREFGAEAYQNGLLRLTIRNDKFEVLWPKLEVYGEHGVFFLSPHARLVDPRRFGR
jgi:hypothetical protein